LVVSLSATPASGGYQVRLKLINQGTDAATDLHLHLMGPGPEFNTRLAETLLPNTLVTKDFFRRVKNLKPGRLPIMALVTCRDQGGFLVSAPGYCLLTVGTPARPILDARADRITLSSKGEVWLLLDNNSQQVVDVTARLFTPVELQAQPAALIISLPPESGWRTHFTVRDLSARPGSAYPLALVLTWQQAGQPQALLVPTQARVAAPASWLHDYILWMLGAAGLLLIWAAWRQWRTGGPRA
jgi:hypothetical protein